MKVSLRVVLKPLLDFIAQFITDTNNPTKVTAAQINAYTKDEVNKLLESKLQLSDVPISYWGQSDSFAITVAMSGSNLAITTQVPSLLAGVRKVMATASLPVSVTSGAVTYVYLSANAGTVTYLTTTVEQAESNTVMYLGKVTGTGTSATLTDFKAVVRVGGKRLSNTRRGSAIPVSNNTGGTSW